jgi:peptide/nickel transport system permease protein
VSAAPAPRGIDLGPVRPKGRVLATLARLFAWPLVLALLLVGLLLRVVGSVRYLWQRPERLEGHGGIGRYVVRGARYLLWRTDFLPPIVGSVPAEVDGRGPWWEVRRRLSRDRAAMLCWIGIVFYVYVAVLAQAGAIARDPARGDPDASYRAPTISFAEMSVGEHPLGTDIVGREVWKLTVHGAKNALWIGLFAALLACVIGLVLGAIAGYFGKWIDEGIVWLYATLQSIPYLLLMLALSFVFQKNPAIRDGYEHTFLKQDLGISLGLFTIVVAVGLTFWVGVCRVVRAEFMKLRDQDFVVAAKSLGVPTRRVIFRHIVPNVFHLVLVSFSLLFMGAIKFEVILSFLGVGMEEGEASWGQMINQAKLELIRADPVWWQITSATVAMFGLLLCVNLFTDALRDALDPRLRD